jgi:peptidyl-prolyl cis-trans isomerase C
MKYLAFAFFFSLPVFFAVAIAADANGVIASYDDTVVLLADELAAEADAMTPAQRARFAGSPKSRENIAKELLVRRQVAALARQDGLTDDPAVQHRLRLLEERLLYEVYMQHAEAAVLDDAAIEKLAYDEYRAYKDKFVTPEAVHVSHILLRVGAQGRDRAQTEALAQELLERLRAGEDFATLATEYSEDPGSAPKGGDLGFFERGRMAKPFEEAAFTLTEPGELSDIVETQFGLHILRFTARREPGQRSFDEVREQLIASNRMQARKRVRLDIIAPLRDPARLRIDAPALEAVFAAD